MHGNLIRVVILKLYHEGLLLGRVEHFVVGDACVETELVVWGGGDECEMDRVVEICGGFC